MRSIIPVLLILADSLFAQTGSPPHYPQGYFRNPLGIPISLAGNFGELRPNHFHMGLDIKTNKVQNYPVYAAADGYVARVKIDAGGFGRAIYINHPNGYTTLYAHLNNFFPALEQYVKQQQYSQEAWAVLLEIPPSLFPVKKGDFIANSGTTGGSLAPHLHFEIRETAHDINLNPLLFGLPVEDHVPPVILRLAVYDRTRSVYEQSPKLYPVKQIAGSFSTGPDLIYCTSPRVSLAISCFDKQTGSTNVTGVYQAVLFDNGVELLRFTMDKISYETTRNVEGHIDYKTRAAKGPYLEHLSALPGYLNGIYHLSKGDGVINLSDGKVHEIKIVVSDPAGNSSELQTRVQFKNEPQYRPAYPGKMFYPGMLNLGEGSNECEFYVGEKGLYDSVHINYRQSPSSNPRVVSDIHSIGAAYIPLQDSLVVSIRPNSNLSPSQMNHVVMQRFAGSKDDLANVQWQNGWAQARFVEFGSFRLVLDETPPQIRPVGWKNAANLSRASRIVIAVKDNLGVYKNFRAELDGKWLRFTNDKGKNFIYIFDEKCSRGRHTLKIRVEDQAGNTGESKFNFVR